MIHESLVLNPINNIQIVFLFCCAIAILFDISGVVPNHSELVYQSILALAEFDYINQGDDPPSALLIRDACYLCDLI